MGTKRNSLNSLNVSLKKSLAGNVYSKFMCNQRWDLWAGAGVEGAVVVLMNLQPEERLSRNVCSVSPRDTLCQAIVEQKDLHQMLWGL